MAFRRWTRDARLSLARIPNIPGLGRAPNVPAVTLRDLWPGDAARGAGMIDGAFRFDGVTYRIPGDDPAQRWERPDLPEGVRRWLHGFAWLRDLRTLGTDEARLRAREIVGRWLDHPATDPLIADTATTGVRLAAWLGNYDFFAATAGDAFRQRLMDRILVEGRTIAAMLPLPLQGWRGLSALRGLLAAGMAMPGFTGLLSRFERYLGPELERLILPDGCMAERSPEAQLQAIRELAEMAALLRAAQLPIPVVLEGALDRLCPVLRAMRHADGGLAVFNGAVEHSADLVDMVLQQGARQRLLAPAMPDGGFIRLSMGRSLLLVDAGKPPPPGFDQEAHAGTLSFEFSHNRQRIFVNCGAAREGEWARALRETAAHTALVLDGQSSSDFSAEGGLSRRPVHVKASHQAQNGAHWLDLSHDGYRASLGATWQRRLYFGENGLNLRGEEIVDGERATKLALRFHLHPEVEAHLTEEGDEIILEAGGVIWRFHQDGGVLALESSVYRAGSKPVRTLQIVVRAPVPPAPVVEPEPVKADEAVAAEVSGGAEEGGEEHPVPPEGEGATEDAASGREESAEAADAPVADAPVAAEPPKAAEPVRHVPPEPTRQVVRWALERINDL